MSEVLLLQGDALHLPLRDASVHCCVTSPPYYGLRSYGIGAAQGEIGQEETLEAYVEAMVQVFREVKRVLRPDGVLFLNLGDAYSSGNETVQPQSTRLPAKNLLGLPWRVAMALQADGWVLRSDCIWDKPSCLPESVQDRPTRSHEYVFLMSKKARYYYDAAAIHEASVASIRPSHHPSGTYSAASGRNDADTHWSGGYATGQTRNARTVWRIPSEPFSGAHFATFPQAMVRRCLLAGSPKAVCSTCAAPSRRVLERQRLLDGHIPVTGTFSRPDEPFRIPPNGVGHSRYTTHTTDHGFEATCLCAAGTAPSVVLDPFAGSGTTGLVARELGHHAVLLDLSMPYLREIARVRLGLAALATWEGRAARAPAIDYSALPLFGGNVCG